MIKAKLAQIYICNCSTLRPIELVDMKVLDTMKTSSIGRRSYALGINNDFLGIFMNFVLMKSSQVYKTTSAFWQVQMKLLNICFNLSV